MRSGLRRAGCVARLGTASMSLRFHPQLPWNAVVQSESEKCRLDLLVIVAARMGFCLRVAGFFLALEDRSASGRKERPVCRGYVYHPPGR